MSTIAGTAARVIALSALVFSSALAEELTPDTLIRAIADDVIAAIKHDPKLTDSPTRVAALVEARVLPHFDFAHTTRIAMGANWRRATPEQQERLTLEFRTLLVRTYSTALLNYRDQVIDVKPLRARPEDAQVTVRSEVRQAGAQPRHLRRGGAQSRRRRPDRTAVEQEPSGQAGSEYVRAPDTTLSVAPAQHRNSTLRTRNRT